MDLTQNLFKEIIAEFIENNLEAKLDVEIRNTIKPS